ncbi:hypothetical protein Sjap_011199 [Stephania japonica]|uniref:Uncharacterized protein n=1 Tax=Stephania japonica TaxID=461633 RepID=A0AAP0JD25_9MAGN
MPQAIGKLHQLQTLPLFVTCEKNGISALENLNNLGGTLDIHRLCLVKEASLAKGGNLIDKGKLRKLGLHWDSDDGHDSCVGDDCDDLQVLKELQPHPNLKELSIEGLRRVEFPGWVSNGLLLPNVVAIEISNCSERKQIRSFGELPCLKSLKIKDISSLEEWAEGNDVIGMFPCLEELEMYNCRNLRRAPHSFPSLKSLIFWNVGGIGVVSITTSLTSLTYLSIRECEDLEFLPEGLLRNNMQLDVVSVDNCPKLQAFREEGLLLTTTNDDDDDMEFPNSSLLRELNIRECNALKCIPDVRGFTSLQRLEIWQCRELETIPKGFLSSLVALESLRVSGFDRLKGTIELSPRLKHLREVQIHRCPNFEGLEISSSSSSSSSSTEQQLQQQQQQLVLFPNYHTLEIMHCHAISSIDVGGFASLRELAIKYCGGLQALEGLPFLTALKKLEIGPFSEDLDCFPLLLLGGDDDDNGEVMTLNPPLLPSLRELTISGWPALQSLPRQLHHLTMLKSLFISDFPNLSALPEWLGNLASLESLEIWECENLTYLPSKEQMQRLTLLKELRIFYCPRLEERFCSDVSEWPKISHIPYVNITGNIMKRTFTGQNFHL